MSNQELTEIINRIEKGRLAPSQKTHRQHERNVKASMNERRI